MSQETEKSSSLGDPKKKKKKYLYLDRFEKHVVENNAQHGLLRHRITLTWFALGGMVLTGLLVLWWIK
jgi:hypothetical protein